MVVFFFGTMTSWNCENSCHGYEDWIGNTEDYVLLHMSALFLKLIVIVAFFVALLRIRNTAT